VTIMPVDKRSSSAPALSNCRLRLTLCKALVLPPSTRRHRGDRVGCFTVHDADKIAPIIGQTLFLKTHIVVHTTASDLHTTANVSFT
jgi:hypothetical protein